MDDGLPTVLLACQWGAAIRWGNATEQRAQRLGAKRPPQPGWELKGFLNHPSMRKMRSMIDIIGYHERLTRAMLLSKPTGAMPPRIVVLNKNLCRATGGGGHLGLSCEGKMCRATGGKGHLGLSCESVFGCTGNRERKIAEWERGLPHS